MKEGVIHRYRKFLPITGKTPIVTLGEGNTPLLRARNIERECKLWFQLHLKCEGFNPTASFKDRGMTIAISKALEEKAQWVICASTGNTSASAAAYSAKARIPCAVVVPEKGVTLGKLSQALMHGAQVMAIAGNFDRALALVQKVCAQYPATLVNSLNPYRLEGQATGAYEICDQLGRAPDYHIIPVGNAGNITAYWMGYTRYHQAKKIAKLPVLLGFQAKGADPIVRGHPIKSPRTVAAAIQIGNPASWEKAAAALKKSKGVIASVNDREILKSYHLLAALEGIFVEPASAASLAGLLKLAKEGFPFQKESAAVCILTGHGLKDPQLALSQVPKPLHLEPKIDAIAKAMGFS